MLEMTMESWLELKTAELMAMCLAGHLANKSVSETVDRLVGLLVETMVGYLAAKWVVQRVVMSVGELVGPLVASSAVGWAETKVGVLGHSLVALMARRKVVYLVE